MFRKTGLWLKLLAIFFVGIFSIYTINTITYAQGQKTINGFFQPIGEFIKKNPELLIDLTKNLNIEEVESDEIVAWINALPITIGELEFRKGLNQNAGMRNQSYSEVFNVLAEEKLVIDYAIKNN